MRWICVVEIETGKIVYVGRSTGQAAQCLVKGTTFDRGNTEQEAIARARVNAEQFRDPKPAGSDAGNEEE